MGITLGGLLHGTIVQSTAESITGPSLYSHYRANGYQDFSDNNAYQDGDNPVNNGYETPLNKLTKVWILGSVGGVIRIVLSIFHTIGHLFALAATGNKGHKYHALAGACHLLRGLIEVIPIVGQIFARNYGAGSRSWWMVKMLNPNKLDKFDELIQPADRTYLEEAGYYIFA